MSVIQVLYSADILDSVSLLYHCLRHRQLMQ